MSGSFKDYVSEQMEGFVTGAGDLSRHAIADIGDSYQEILMADASISPPDGLTAEMETVTTAEPETPAMSDAQMQAVIDTREHEAEVENYQNLDSPDVG